MLEVFVRMQSNASVIFAFRVKDGASPRQLARAVYA